MAEQSPEELFIRALENARLPNGAAMDINQYSLRNTLKIIAHDMNTKLTHYQLELIQNADDNKYAPGVEPILTLAFRDDGYLWIGCNEVGFDEASVRAICEIDGSTKKATGAQKGYIGEKVVGFKSVFTIADKVWISSGKYQFSLSGEGLVFCLRIPKKKDQIHVKADMLSLKPELLLFLRKLRTINVMIGDRNEHVQYRFSLHRTDNTDNIENGYTTTQLSRRDISPIQATNSEEVVVLRPTTRSMPEEDKRPGIKESEVVLTFPTNLVISSRMTYNYLPVRDHGMPFTLQGDFITTANREDIIRDNKWNLALVAATNDLIAQCVRTFNKTETDQMKVFKHKWPRFVKPMHAASDTIMADFFPTLRGHLRREPVVESRSGHLKTPASLTVLAERWHDRSDPPQPLFAEPHHLEQYISEHYNPQELAVLATLGLKTANPQDFANLLKQLRPEQLQQKSYEWHSMVAEALLKAPPVSSQHLTGIKMIPLRDGSWVEMAKDGHAPIYFADTSNSVLIPNGVELQIVESNAGDDFHRRLLFEKLHVKDLDPFQVCKLILKRHEGLSSHTNELPLEDLIQHAKYLYRHQHCIPTDKYFKGLKFAVAGREGAVSGCQLYMDSIVPNTFKMSYHFQSNADCKFVHPSYFDNVSDLNKQSWHNWLRRMCGISTKPKLVSQQRDVSAVAAKYEPKYYMCPLFQRLVDLPNSMIWLTLLRDEWLDYKDFLRLLPENYLQQQLVTCHNGTRKPLNKVYLTTADVTKEPLARSGLNLLDVGDDSGSWRELDVLGFKRKADVELYLALLRKAAKDEIPGVMFSDVVRLMQGIELHSKQSEDNHSIIRNAFKQDRLVAVSNGSILSWIALDNSLSEDYFEVESLFTGALERADATAYDIAERLGANSGDIQKMENIKALLQALSDLIPGQETMGDLPLEQLRQNLIFPVRQLNGSLSLAAADDETWYIADDRRLQECFQGRIALLDFPIQQIPRLMALLNLLEVSRRRLSGSVIEEMEIQGTSKLLPKLSAELQSKAKYIALLVPVQNKTTVEAQLQTIEVYDSKRMQQKRYVQIGGRRVYGTSESGKAVMQEHKAPVQLHCRNSAMKLKRTPWYFISKTIATALCIPEMHSETLMTVLITSAGPLIENILSINGLWDEAVSDIDDIDEDESEEEVEEGGLLIEKNNENEIYDSEDDSSNDCLFVSEHKRPEPSSKHSPAETSSRNGGTGESPASDEESGPDDSTSGTPSKDRGSSDEPGNKRTPSPPIPPRSSRSRPSAATVHYNQAVLSEDKVRKVANKAQQERTVIDEIIKAAGDYAVDSVRVYQPSLSTNSSNTDHLTGLSIGKTKPFKKLADLNGRTRYHGELFVRELLNTIFDSSDDSWTSPLRTWQDLNKIEDGELEQSSTFTEIGTNTVDIITEWLQGIGYNAKNAQDEYPETYHIFVKATEGNVDEPFSFSNHELELAKSWATSESDIVMIFRLHHIRAEPQFVVLVDPIRLMASGELTMTALDGFSMAIV